MGGDRRRGSGAGSASLILWSCLRGLQGPGSARLAPAHAPPPLQPTHAGHLTCTVVAPQSRRKSAGFMRGRTMQRTSYPSSSALRTTCRPSVPVPPTTSTVFLGTGVPALLAASPAWALQDTFRDRHLESGGGRGGVREGWGVSLGGLGRAAAPGGARGGHGEGPSPPPASQPASSCARRPGLPLWQATRGSQPSGHPRSSAQRRAPPWPHTHGPARPADPTLLCHKGLRRGLECGPAALEWAAGHGKRGRLPSWGAPDGRTRRGACEYTSHLGARRGWGGRGERSGRRGLSLWPATGQEECLAGLRLEPPPNLKGFSPACHRNTKVTCRSTQSQSCKLQEVEVMGAGVRPALALVTALLALLLPNKSNCHVISIGVQDPAPTFVEDLREPTHVIGVAKGE